MKKNRIGRDLPRGFCKFLLFMKFLLVLVIMGTSLAFGANTYSQNAKFTLSLHNVTVRTVFKAIEEQSEFIFFYQDQELDLSRTVSIDIKDKAIEDILQKLFDGTGNVYVIRDRQIVIGKTQKKIEKGEGSIQRVFPEVKQQFTVTGRVTDGTNGEPLPGVNILVEGTSVGGVTNAEGVFTLNVPSSTSILLFSFVGYTSERIEVANRSKIDVILSPDIQQLQEVVTVGYGVQKKINLSGAVDVVTSRDLDNRPVNNVVQALQGLAPNLNILVGNEGGELGGKMSMNIRGIGSISGSGGNPYILVDGIEQSIYNINPNDVENISVLKDAAASAIYGARAAFGVILVTTKKGKNDGIVVNYSNNYSFASPLHLPKMVNSIKFAEYLNLAAENDGTLPVFQPIIISNMRKYQAGELKDWTMPIPWAPNMYLTYAGGWANTDWFKVDYKDWVPKSTHNISLSGGDKRTQFYVSGSTFDQAGLMRFGNDSYVRNNLNAKINTRVFDWLRLNFLSKFNRTILDRPSYNKDMYYSNIARRWPTNGLYLPNGALNFEGEQNWLQNGGRYVENTNELTINPGIEIEPVKNWVIYANYRWKMNTSGFTNHEAKVSGTYVDGTTFYLRPNNSFAIAQGQSLYNSPNVYTTYNKKMGEHEFTILAGVEQEETTYNFFSSKKNDLVSDTKPSLSTGIGKTYNTDSLGHWATRSVFGRLNYSFNEKYLLEISARRDGSSKFDKDYHWGLFPSASIAYIISHEDFWSPVSSYISMMKLRGSYGSLGNQDVLNYLFVERLPISSDPLPYIIGSDRLNFVGMPGLTSPDLTWETINTSNIGIDFGFLKNKLTASFDYFIRNTYDMLGPAESLPALLGTPVPKSNNATLQTKGFEAMVSWKDNLGDFRYDASLMLSDATTKIMEYNNPQNLLSAPYYKGMTLGEIWGYTTVGLFQSDADAQAWDQSYICQEVWTAGDVKYADLNHDNKIDVGKNTVDDHGDLSIIGNSIPRYNYSILLNAAWKGIDFSMIWQGVGKRDVWLDSPHFWGAGWVWSAVAFEEHMDYWTEQNRDAYFAKPRMNQGYRNKQVQTRFLQNGAYLRLKSLQLGYTIPRFLSEKVFIKNFKIFAVGENLLTHTKLFKAFDPETTGGAYGAGFIYPLQKNFSVGVNITF
jgi:TonB-linked SusC/RagA family outer membrane protein